MSSLELFMRKNKVERENIKLPVTKSILDENGNPVEWEFRPLTTRENAKLRKKATILEQVPGKMAQKQERFNTELYVAQLIATTCVFPDLLNAELQDSYGVNKPEELVHELIDNPGEYDELASKLQKYNGYDTNLDEEVDEAKN